MQRLLLGIDFGTSGLRASVLVKDPDRTVEQCFFDSSALLCQVDTPLNNLDKHNTSNSTVSVSHWKTALLDLFLKLKEEINLSEISDIIVDATSSTVCLFDPKKHTYSLALMYFSNDAKNLMKTIEEAFPEIRNTPASGATSTLAKSILLASKQTSKTKQHILHQADLINQYLGVKQHITDYNNALKLGYDPRIQDYSDCVKSAISRFAPNLQLPKVVAPGSIISRQSSHELQAIGLNQSINIRAGTTDSIAAFLASGAQNQNDLVISLGSTLAFKKLSSSYIQDANTGLYSHKLWDQWLVGGASNSGGKLLLAHHSIEQVIELINMIQQSPERFEDQQSNRYYPILSQGERFPVQDPNFIGKLEQLPVYPYVKSDMDSVHQHARYINSICLGLTHIEQQAIELLNKICATPIQRIFAVGNGQKNNLWQQYRHQFVDAKHTPAFSQEASLGVLRLIKDEINEFRTN